MVSKEDEKMKKVKGEQLWICGQYQSEYWLIIVAVLRSYYHVIVTSLY